MHGFNLILEGVRQIAARRRARSTARTSSPGHERRGRADQRAAAEAMNMTELAYTRPLVPTTTETGAASGGAARAGAPRADVRCVRAHASPPRRCARCRSIEPQATGSGGTGTSGRSSCRTRRCSRLRGACALQRASWRSTSPSIRFVGNLVAAGADPDEVDPASIAIGEPVRVVFARLRRACPFSNGSRD